jgi:hypothetical protein
MYHNNGGVSRDGHHFGGAHPLDGHWQSRDGGGQPDLIDLSPQAQFAAPPQGGSPLRTLFIVAGAIFAAPVIVALVALFFTK